VAAAAAAQRRQQSLSPLSSGFLLRRTAPATVFPFALQLPLLKTVQWNPKTLLQQ
jgi:hypothetical protein